MVDGRSDTIVVRRSFHDPGWDANKVGDFNGDGKDDILWRNHTTGENVIWLMDGRTVTSSVSIFTSTAWAVSQVGDYNGDGKDDLVWKSLGAGGTALWLMNGTSPASTSVILADSNWVMAPANGP